MAAVAKDLVGGCKTVLDLWVVRFIVFSRDGDVNSAALFKLRC